MGLLRSTQAFERRMSRSMSFLHVGERLLAAPQHNFRYLMPDFPDKRPLAYRATPHNDTVDFIDVGIAAHVTFNFPCENQSMCA
jgi:hypothetical protein